MESVTCIGRDHLEYYLDLAREDFQERGGERPGYWIGKGAEHLGLVGQVGRNEIYNLFDGLDPSGQRPLVQVQAREDRASHRAGWDMTLSAPKSVSVAWALGSPATREAIESAHREAVSAAVDYVEGELASVRRGAGGKTIESALITAAVFEHVTSRSGDPNLHSHIVLTNVAIRPDGSTGTLHSPILYGAGHAIGAVYRAQFARSLEDRGAEVEPDRFSFRLPEVPRELERAMSKRRAQIEEYEERVQDPRDAARAVLRTRPPKGPPVPREEMFRRWREEAGPFGWGQEQAGRLMDPSRERPAHDVSALWQALDGWIAERRQDNHAFQKHQFIKEAATVATALGVSAAETRQIADAYLAQTKDLASRPMSNIGQSYRFVNPEREERMLDARAQERQEWRDLAERKAAREAREAARANRDPASDPEGRLPRPRAYEQMGDLRLVYAGSESYHVFDKRKPEPEPSAEEGSGQYSGVLFVYRNLQRVSRTAEEAARTYNELLETFVRFTREQGEPRESLIVARSREEADELNAMVQAQRRLDGEVETAGIRAEHAVFYTMDRVRVGFQKATRGARAHRTGMIERIDPQGAFVDVRFDDGGKLELPAAMLPLVQLHYSIPREELSAALSPKRLFVLLDERAAEGLAPVTPKHPTNAFEFLVAESGRQLSVRLAHELDKSDALLKKTQGYQAAHERHQRGYDLGMDR